MNEITIFKNKELTSLLYSKTQRLKNINDKEINTIMASIYHLPQECNSLIRL